MIKLTKKRSDEIDNWVERYDIDDYFGEEYPDKFVLIGYSRNNKIYKKVVR